MTALPLELELIAAKICADQYPHSRFKLTAKIEHDDLQINFEGYSTQGLDPKYSPYPDPTHPYYRNSAIDFSINWRYGMLGLSGLWRSEILSIEYSPSSLEWMNEDCETIPTPYPDGDKFEAIAAALYPMMVRHFPQYCVS